MQMVNGMQRLAETAQAFDRVAASYDGPRGNNALVQLMRAELWHAVTRYAPPGACLLDIGCGTGLDAEFFARQGYHVVGIDPSREMVAQARRRVAQANLSDRVRIETLAAHELDRLGQETFDAIYSDLGPLNCAPDLEWVARQCCRCLRPSGFLIVSVIGRYCPWEMLYYGLRGEWAQARRRLMHDMVAVQLDTGIVWTRYYSPREFLAHFDADFRLVTYRALNLFLPPPYLIHWYERTRLVMRVLHGLEARVAALPLLRDLGDHFLMVLQST